MPLIEVISSEENDPAVSSAPKPATAAEVAAGIGALGLDPAQHHGGSEWSQVEPVGLTNTERAQMDELREKYGKYQRERDAVGGGDAPHTEHALAQAQARMDAEFRARDAAQPGSDGDDADDAGREAVAPSSRIQVCDVCRGMRVTKTEYNHRVMERMCERCEGEGVLQDGKPIVTPGEAAAEEAKRSRTDPVVVVGRRGGDDDDDAMRRRVQEAIAKDDRLMRYAELSTVCDAIEEKMDGYAREIVDANARLDSWRRRERGARSRGARAGQTDHPPPRDAAGETRGVQGGARALGGGAGEGRDVRVVRGPGDGRGRAPVKKSSCLRNF